jgi:hypothetical protein
MDVDQEADDIEALVQPLLDRGADPDRICTALFVLAVALAERSRRREWFAQRMAGEAKKLAKKP